LNDAAGFPIRLYVFGSPRLEVNGETAHVDTRKSLALLIYLALGSGSDRRDRLVNLFWPDSDPVHGRAVLRRTLSALKSILPDGILVSDRDTIGLRVDRLWVDAREFRELLKLAYEQTTPGEVACDRCEPLLERAVALYQADFMEGFSLPGSYTYDEWQFFTADTLRREVIDSLQRLVAALETQNDLERALLHAHRWLALDRQDEAVHRDLMRLYARAGQRSAALRQYHECVAVLQDQLGVKPQPATTSLYRSIESGQVTFTALDPGHAALPAHSTAVIPAPVSTSQLTGGGEARPENLTELRPRHNLPILLTSFVGRKHEVDEILRQIRLPHCRLLTLVGAGGTGKTRLALQAAEALAAVQEDPSMFPDGIWFIELAGLVDSAQILHLLARVLDLRETLGRTLLDAVRDYVRSRRMLLVFDNCEHVIGVIADIAQTLLRSNQQLHILATSRELLGVEGERALHVYPLPAPSHDRFLDLDDLSSYDSVRLFIARAQAVSQTFALTAANSAAVAQICRRLDGIPLAIELAAVRLRSLSPEQIAKRLDDAFHLLVGGSRTSLPRQQTLRASISWSYDYLSPDEQQLLQRLSVFVRGWTYEAAEAVCASGKGPSQFLDLLTSVVSKSLVIFDSSQSEPRYRMLETIRQYALEKLQTAGDESAARTSHSEYYICLLHTTHPGILSSLFRSVADGLENEKDNVLAALDWALQRGQLRGILTSVDSLINFFYSMNLLSKGEEIIEGLLEHCEYPQAVILQARLGALHFAEGKYAKASEEMQECLAHAREAADWPEIAFCLHFLGNVRRWQGISADARAYYQECLTIYQGLGDTAGTGMALYELGETEAHLGNYAVAREYYLQSLAIAREVDTFEKIAYNLDKLGGICFYIGQYADSTVYYRESLDYFERLGDKFGQFLAWGGLGFNAWARGGSSLPEARDCMWRSLLLCHEVGLQYHMVDRYGLLALVENSLGEYEKGREHAAAGLAIYRLYDNPIFAPLNLCVLGEAEAGLGDFAAARQHFLAALKKGIDLQTLPTVAMTLYNVAAMWVRQSPTLPAPEARQVRLLALRIALFVANYPAAWYANRQRAQALLAELEAGAAGLDMRQVHPEESAASPAPNEPFGLSGGLLAVVEAVNAQLIT
jgi:predicted ATPase/DNA-binding SARP family transcriptional activator